MTGKADKELVDYRMEKSRESIAATKVIVKVQDIVDPSLTVKRSRTSWTLG